MREKCDPTAMDTTAVKGPLAIRRSLWLSLHSRPLDPSFPAVAETLAITIDQPLGREPNSLRKRSVTPALRSCETVEKLPLGDRTVVSKWIDVSYRTRRDGSGRPRAKQS